MDRAGTKPGRQRRLLWGEHLRKTGFLAGEESLNSTAVAYLLRTATQRFRPLESNGNGQFLTTSSSFRSGHAAIAVTTESPRFFNFGSTNHGNLNYWNQTYRDGYPNEGVLIGNTVGRMGRSIQAWLTYWPSPTSTVQFAYKHSTVSADFIPGGGAWQDYQLRYDKYLKSGLYWKNQVQFEHISHYPILFDSSRRNLTAIVEFGWAPRREC